MSVGMVAVPVWRGAHFYFAHRFVHIRAIYKYVHSLHHRNGDIEPFAGLCMVSPPARPAPPPPPPLALRTHTTHLCLRGCHSELFFAIYCIRSTGIPPIQFLGCAKIGRF